MSIRTDLKKPSVLVIGDVILDKYWFGGVERISPEAPIPIVNKNDQEHRPGGAANVAYNLGSLGVKTSIASFIGKDSDGLILQKELNKIGVNTYLYKSKNFNTISKLRILRNTHQLLRVDEEEVNSDLHNHERLFNHVKKNIHKYHSIIISDYGKGALTDSLIHKVIKLCNKTNTNALVDPKGFEFDKYSNADVITPNLSEFEGVVGATESIQDRVVKGKLLRKKLNLKYLLITMGKDGMLIIDKNQHMHFKALAKNVFDVSGAGDTVISTLSAFISANYSINDSVMYANIAAAIVVGKVGTSKVTIDELEEHKNNKKHYLVSNKELKHKVLKYKDEGKKVVMTNGCFDLIHPGHIAYLEEAKSLGDILIVAINTDASVKKLKGNDRPINTLNDRAKILKALNCVDYVISFSSTSPKELYSKILPDILVKGGDYKSSNVEGGAEVLKDGGAVEILKFIDGYSSSSIIDRIKNIDS